MITLITKLSQGKKLLVLLVFILLSPVWLYIIACTYYYFLIITGHYVVADYPLTIMPVVEEAIVKKDRSVCNKIRSMIIFGPTTSTLIGNCNYLYSVRTADVESCLPSNYSCVLEIAENKKDPSICTRIEDESEQGLCFNLYIRNTKGPIDICDLATSDSSKDNCVLGYFQEREINASICEKYFLTEQWKEACINNITDD